MNRHEVRVERLGNQLAVHAEFLTELVRDTCTDAWATDRRVEFEEYGYANAQLEKALEADVCLSGPPQVSDESERLSGEAEERWAALDLSTGVFLSLPDAQALYEALGVALLADAGSVARWIPGRAA